jgi:hypothetical protein
MILVTSKERLLQYLEYKGIDKSSFYKETGLKRGLLDADKMKGALTDVFIAKIIARYDINLRWLITGQGEMIEAVPLKIDTKPQLDLIVKLAAENALLKEELKKLKSQKNYQKSDCLPVAAEP